MNTRFPPVIGVAVLAAALVMLLPAPASADDSSYGGGSGGNPRMAEARQLIEMGSWGSAIWSLKQVVAEEPGNADAHNLLAYSYRNVGKYEVAEEHYERALQIAPEHRGAHAYLGVLYLETGRDAMARENLRRLRELCGSDCPEYESLQQAIQRSS